MKKMISLLCIAAMVLSLAACSGSQETQPASTEAAVSTEAPAIDVPKDMEYIATVSI